MNESSDLYSVISFGMLAVLVLGPPSSRCLWLLFLGLIERLWRSHGGPGFRIFFKGASRANAQKICETGFFLVNSKHRPTGIWFSDRIEVALKYSGKTGHIVVISVKQDLPLKDIGSGRFVYEIPEAKRSRREYYDINGLKPIALINTKGKRIRNVCSLAA